jgi:multisubunit Na+/H+ antiporter MnhF subunit
MSEGRDHGPTVDEWRALRSKPVAAGDILRNVRQRARRASVLRLIELLTIAGIVAISGYAVLAGPTTPDAVWAAGILTALALGSAVAVVAHTRDATLLPADTAAFLVSFERAANRRIRILRAGLAVLAVEGATFIPFIAWRQRVRPGSLASDHGLASLVGAALLLLLSAGWIRSRMRDAGLDLARCRELRTIDDAVAGRRRER